jgi:hypothetical protein
MIVAVAAWAAMASAAAGLWRESWIGCPAALAGAWVTTDLEAAAAPSGGWLFQVSGDSAQLAATALAVKLAEEDVEADSVDRQPH